MRKSMGLLLVVMLLGSGYLFNHASAFEMGNQIVDITVTDSFVSRYIWRG